MEDFNQQQMLALYTVLQDRHVEERVNHDPATRKQPITTSVEPLIDGLEAQAHRHGFFFWHHFEDDGLGGDKSVYTLERIAPAGTFDRAHVETRFNELERFITDETPGNDALYSE